MVNFMLCVLYHNTGYSLIFFFLSLIIKEINPRTRSQQIITEGSQGLELMPNPSVI